MDTKKEIPDGVSFLHFYILKCPQHRRSSSHVGEDFLPAAITISHQLNTSANKRRITYIPENLRAVRRNHGLYEQALWHFQVAVAPSLELRSCSHYSPSYTVHSPSYTVHSPSYPSAFILGLWIANYSAVLFHYFPALLYVLVPGLRRIPDFL